MSETFHGDVLRVIPPEELADHELEPALEELAASRGVLVCRRGGHPSLLELIWAFVRRDPIEAVTVVADVEDEDISEGDEITAQITETELFGVYEVTGSMDVDRA